jgi:hypothetical protein
VNYAPAHSFYSSFPVTRLHEVELGVTMSQGHAVAIVADIMYQLVDAVAVVCSETRQEPRFYAAEVKALEDKYSHQEKELLAAMAAAERSVPTSQNTELADAILAELSGEDVALDDPTSSVATSPALAPAPKLIAPPITPMRPVFESPSPAVQPLSTYYDAGASAPSPARFALSPARTRSARAATDASLTADAGGAVFSPSKRARLAPRFLARGTVAPATAAVSAARRLLAVPASAPLATPAADDERPDTPAPSAPAQRPHATHAAPDASFGAVKARLNAEGDAATPAAAGKLADRTVAPGGEAGSQDAGPRSGRLLRF